jgi:FkbM family methyltransferase
MTPLPQVWRRCLQRDIHYSELANLNRAELETAIRERVQTIYLGDGKVLARVLGSFKMFLSSNDLGFGCHLMLDGYWESWLTLFLARYIRPGMTIIDVGANFGYYTVLFSALSGPSGHVIAIEPVPTTVALLKDTIELNGFASRTRLVAAAAGAEPSSTAHLVVPDREPKNSTIVDVPREGSTPVPSFTIDELVRDFERIDLVKIDAEGAEINVIAGMRETIARCRPAILLEYNAARYNKPDEFLNYLLGEYGAVKNVGFDGCLENVSAEAILSTRVGEDWLLFFPNGRIWNS